jgi:hypothetical protein
MGWREALYKAACLASRMEWNGHGYEPDVDVDDLVAGMRELSPAERIALARELLPPGFVVAREVETLADMWDLPDGANDWRAGWNACRAAMMEEP